MTEAIKPRAFPLAVGRRRRYLQSRFDLSKIKILELGAMDMPVFYPDEANIEFLDYFSDAEFALLSQEGKLSRPLENLVPVEHVAKNRYFAANISKRYDLIIAAHVVEHIPDPITWLNELSQLLTPNGAIFLAIPDRRYTFDFMRKETSPIELLRQYNRKSDHPDIYAIADFLYYKRNIRAADVWGPSPELDKLTQTQTYNLPEAMKAAISATTHQDSHINVHCSVFSAPTFKGVWQGISEMGLLPLDLQEVAEVGRDGNEFWTLFRAKPVVNQLDRRAGRGRNFIEGRDGILFLDNDTNSTMDQIAGRAALSSSTLKLWQRTLRARVHLLKDLGATYKLVIAPAKEVVLAQYLPDGISLSQNRPAAQLLADPQLKTEICYPLDGLRELDAKNPCSYPKGDTHFGEEGAYVVYREAMKSLGYGRFIIPRSQLVEGEEEVMGDLMVNSPTRQLERVKTLRPANSTYRVTFNNNKKNRGRVVSTENPSARRGSLVMFRDSFSEPLIPFFAQTFRHCTFVWQPYVDFDVVEAQKADVVLNVMAERFLQIVPDDLQKLSLEDLAAIGRLRE